VYGTVDVATVARELGMSEAWVYRHADELGVERRGSGPKARLRFDLERARAAFIQAPPSVEAPRNDRARRARPTTPLLPVRGKAA
jgi:hypothetical protein